MADTHSTSENLKQGRTRAQGEVMAKTALSRTNKVKPEPSNGFCVIDPMVCVYCANMLRSECLSVCSPEGLYRHLVPKELSEWGQPPQLPEMAKLVDYDAATRLAILYLATSYLGRELKKYGEMS